MSNEMNEKKLLEEEMRNRFPDHTFELSRLMIDSSTFLPYYRLRIDGKPSTIAITPETLMDSSISESTVKEIFNSVAGMVTSYFESIKP